MGQVKPGLCLSPGKKQTICPGVIDSHLKTKGGTCLFNERLAVFSTFKTKKGNTSFLQNKKGSLFQLEGVQTKPPAGPGHFGHVKRAARFLEPRRLRGLVARFCNLGIL